MTVSVRIAQSSEIPALAASYRAWGYHTSVAPDAVMLVAERDGRVVGLVRRTIEHGVVMLRGMWIDPTERRRGIGTTLLQAFVRDLPRAECLCIPFAHLTSFYGQAGFAVVGEETAPAWLLERLLGYRRDGHAVVIMRRPPDE